MSDELDIFRTLLKVLSWANTGIDLLVCIAAFARLGASRSGVLIGGGFAALFLTGVGMKIARVVTMTPEAMMEDSFMTRMLAFEVCGSMVAATFFICVAIGLFMLPRSLAPKSRGSGGGAPAT